METLTRHGTVDVYAVGVLSDLLRLRSALRVPASDFRQYPGVTRSTLIRDALRKLRYEARYIAGQVKAGNWRAVRSSFNGYLVEPIWLDGPAWRRAGAGWTKARALRDFDRHVGARP